MEKYLIPFLTAFILTVFLTYIFIWIGRKIKWCERKSFRHIHKKRILRTGGLAMSIAFNAAIFLDKNLFITPELYGFMFGTVILMLIGVWDDVKEIFWKIQLFAQIAVAVLVFIIGVRISFITNPLTGGIIRLDFGWWVVLSAALVILWIILIINAVNWIDGIDGLSGGIAFVVAVSMFILSLRPEVNQPPVAILCAILAGVILGFLIFNFYPSRVLAGTSGAMFMGFSLAVLAIFSGTKIATTLLILAVPVIDFLWVIGERIRKKRSIFKSDKNHLHHKLMELGWPQSKIALSYWIITAVVAAVALNVRVIGKGITLAVVTITVIFILIGINKKISALSKSR